MHMRNEEERNHKEDGECSCMDYAGHHWMCGGGMRSWHGGKFFLLRWILGMIILWMVLLVGIKIGEFKGSVEGSSYGGLRGNRMMIRGYNDYDYPGDYYPMQAPMRNNTGTSPNASGAPAPSL